MTLFYSCTFGALLDLCLAERFGERVEIEALEFINSIPIEWRLLRKDAPLFDWRKGVPYGKMMAFHDLQVPAGFGTRGTPGSDVSLETRGIGDARIAVWLRDRTYPVPSSDLVTDFGTLKAK